MHPRGGNRVDWDDFWFGLFILIGICAVAAAITIGVVSTNEMHKSAINNCLNHNRAPSECKGL